MADSLLYVTRTTYPCVAVTSQHHEKDSCLTTAFFAALLGICSAQAAAPGITFSLPEYPAPGSTGEVFVDAADNDGDLASITVWITKPNGYVTESQVAYGYYGNITMNLELEAGTYVVETEVRDAASNVTLASTRFTSAGDGTVPRKINYANGAP